MNAERRIIEAFYHERLGAILVCTTRNVPLNKTTLHYLRTSCDGDPEYLASVTENLRTYWLEGEPRSPSLN